MTFQAYLDNIYAKTGKTAADFKALAHQKGLTTHAEILAWLKADYDLGTGHARAIADVILHEAVFTVPVDDKVTRHFTGGRARWRPTYDDLLKQVSAFGTDVSVSPTASYLGLVRSGRKFAVVQVSADRLDIGIKLKGTAADHRFEEAGSWNPMVTHRVRITEPAHLDAEVLAWLQQAYERA